MKRISITGPESTGKSLLARQLADHYQTASVPEIARGYLENLGRPYNSEDIVKIAKEQLATETRIAQKANRLLFCDTDLLVTKIWSLFKFGTCDPWILEQVEQHRYELYLLCDIDLPWEEDPLREHPHDRLKLFELYLEELDAMKVKYAIISGLGANRLDHAISIVDQTFGLGPFAGKK